MFWIRVVAARFTGFAPSRVGSKVTANAVGFRCDFVNRSWECVLAQVSHLSSFVAPPATVWAVVREWWSRWVGLRRAGGFGAPVLWSLWLTMLLKFVVCDCARRAQFFITSNSEPRVRFVWRTLRWVRPQGARGRKNSYFEGWKAIDPYDQIEVYVVKTPAKWKILPINTAISWEGPVPGKRSQCTADQKHADCLDCLEEANPKTHIPSKSTLLRRGPPSCIKQGFEAKKEKKKQRRNNKNYK